MQHPHFLQLVADDLLATFGSNLSHVCVIFPGRRARLFLNPLLARSGGTVWAPRYMDMSGLMQSLSPYQMLDPVEAVCLLYRVYAGVMDDAESIDEFYPWGSVLLSDFDDIDKHLVDARQLFANITAWQSMDSLAYLTKEQEEALRHFFANFSVERHTELKEKFLKLWNKMHDIYLSWHGLMSSRGAMTEGAMFRHVMEDGLYTKLLEDESVIYAFVGFNVLNTVEEKLMRRLQQAGRARFYWDYDNFYVKNLRQTGADGRKLSEAGLFMSRNLDMFPSALPGSCFDNMLCDKHITYIAAGGNNVQARWVKQWVSSLQQPTSTRNAIVLCDETLLNPVLHAIPDSVHGGPSVANITMGYPVSQTQACNYMQLLLGLQTEGWDASRHRFMQRHKRLVQCHPFFHGDPYVHGEGIQWLLEYLRTNISGCHALCGTCGAATNRTGLEQDAATSQEALEREAVFKIYTTLTRLLVMANEGTLTVNTATLSRILLRAVQTMSVPFHGEPLRGLQVMGMLETRCLDFDNLLMLSVGEGFLPRNTHTSSFIPYHLRQPFGLTTIEHRVAVQAYYFYRLLQRAKNITCTYSTAVADGMKNEMSRFLRQLLADTQLPVTMLSLAPELKLQQSNVRLEAAKTDEVMALLRRNVSSIAPTTLNTYLQCQLRFFLHKVAGINEPDSPEEGTIDSATFGTIFHDSAQAAYEMIGHSHITADDLERFVGRDGKATPQSHALLLKIVESKFDADYFAKLPDTDHRYTGQMLIQRDVIADYLRLLLLHDYRIAPFDILKLEEWCTAPVTLADGTVVHTGGKIDRLDVVTVDGAPTVRVVDYKSGAYHADKLNVKDFDTLFAEGGYALQTFVYAMAVCLDGERRPVVPALFYIQQGANTDYNPILTYGGSHIADFHELSADMYESLKSTLEEIFDPSIPFRAAPLGSDACKYCPFIHLCGR